MVAARSASLSSEFVRDTVRFSQPYTPSDSCVVRDMRATESLAVRPATRLAQPVVIGHRGAPAYRPEHTAASYQLAIDLGAELIEPDVVVSRDGVLVVRHESELSLSTDVAGRPEFADRRTTKEVDGEVLHRLVRRGLHPRRAAHAARGRADARAAAAEHRLRRALRHPHPRRGRLAGAHALHRRPPDPGARRAQARRLGHPARAADGRAGRRRAAPSRRRPAPTGRSWCSPSSRRCCATCARCSARTARRWSSWSTTTPPATRWSPAPGLREISTYAAGHRPQPRAASCGTRRPARPASRLVDEAHRAALAVVLLDAAGGERVPARAPAGGRRPRRPGRRARPRPASCSPWASTA